MMSINFEPTQERIMPYVAHFDFQEHLPFLEVVSSARAEFQCLISELSTVREKEDTEAALTLSKKGYALAFALQRHAEAHPEAFAETVFSKVARCASDWRDLLYIPLVADNGVVPRLGVPGLFYVTESGFEYAVMYCPHKFAADTDHFAFQHVSGTERVNDPCPLSKTGFKSAFVTIDHVDATGSVSAAARMYIRANEIVPAKECAQLALF